MARSTMTTLIARVSLLVNDPANAVFDVDTVQEALDRYKRFVRYAPLRYQYSVDPTTHAVQWKEFFADVGDWEDDPTFVDAGYNVYNSSRYTFDPLTGQLTFSSSVVPPVKIVGQTYAVFDAAIYLLQLLLAQLMQQFDFTDGDQRAALGQQVGGVQATIAGLQARAPVGAVGMGRDDVTPFY